MVRRGFVFAAVLLLVCAPAEGRRRAVSPPHGQVSAVEWLKASATPFATTAARSGVDDLAPLRGIVGGARVVALGEATHGSREFFTMKHRILEYLVEREGFTVFAIEANLPEADRVDDYVLHGTGDPAAALAGMYFWTWNTDEVLDMIEWMREYNLRRGDRPPVRFRGFDAQIATGTVPRLDDYLRRVDPARAAATSALYDCIRTQERSEYLERSSSYREQCAAKIGQAHALLAARREEYASRSDAAEYESHLRYARVIVQAEAFWTRRGNRDHFMAENVEWLADTAHPGERLVLWAHNGHVAADDAFRMGAALKRRFGADVVLFAFDFDQGSFSSWGPDGLGTYSTERFGFTGWEEFFFQAGRPRYFIDLRNPWSAEAAKYLKQTRTMWSIGALWDPVAVQTRHRWPVAVQKAFDVMIYIQTTTASRLR